MNYLKTYSKFIAMEYRDTYPSVWSLGGALVGSVLSLCIYWFTSKAFAPSMKGVLNSDGIDYFNFIFSGEIILTLPLLLIEGTIQVIRQSVAGGILETFVALPTRTASPLLMWTLSKLPLEIIRLTILIFLAAIFFGFQIKFVPLLFFFAFILCSLPFFLGLGLLSATILILFGRGEKGVSFTLSILTLLSGLYFPTHVLPDYLQKTVAVTSPFYVILTRAREILYSGEVPPAVEWAVIFALGLGIFFFSLYVLGIAFEKVRTQGRNFLLRY